MNQSRRAGTRQGFTLVELLMVILIISMLIALLLPAVNAARIRGIETSVLSQLTVLVQGLEDFKSKYGAYPPDPNWSDVEILTFLKRAWPRYAWDINVHVPQIKALDEAEILVFWLGGRWDSAQQKLTGFNADPRPIPPASPFSMGGQRTQPFQFDETRIFDGDSDGFPEYYPPNSRPQDSGPFAYFAARPNKTYYLPPSGTSLPFYQDPRGVAQGRAVPYSFQQNGRFKNEDGFQIIAPGIDNHYGSGVAERIYPTGQGYTSGDVDNLTSFARGRLGEQTP